MFSALTTAFSVLLVVLSGVLIVSHRRAWRRVEEEDRDEKQREFARRQKRRRIQASGMIGIVGAAMFVGQFLANMPLLMGFYWSGVILLVLWFLILAIADVVATQQHYSRLRRDIMIEEAKLQAEANRIRTRLKEKRSRQGNGRQV